MERRRAREAALQALFGIDLGHTRPELAVRHALEVSELGEPSAAFVEQLVRGVLAHREEIDARIQRFSPEWSLERMANVDRNVLRLAVFEILHLPDMPPSVSINEAVELAKKYGDKDSSRFVNGILGQVARELAAGREGTEPE
ncbi:transcription antitermination factor NusB [Limnochorda pilosa]|uniref:Transcription antitermination protein NusB n=1 Tax=Limnochorda pilosa TaxID=1555112 RepID=A0A0K2SNL1_LIMPI|nr:transcription antitermination factor NusB [Limnochorda pilosa]BAS28424.1 transcription antitermination protein NusB [Limnochorda pilosa]